jgi:multiple sugar transport system permease protein
MKHSRRPLGTVLFYLFAGALGLFVAIPFFWMIVTSLKDRGALMAVPIQWIPESPSLDAYTKLFQIFPFMRAFLNSCIVSIAATAITLLSASMAAYAFAKLRFRGREGLFVLVLATMMIPSQVSIIPIFIVLKNVGLLNRFAGLLAPCLFNAFAIFFLRQQIATIPADYTDAAVMDGATHFRIFRQVVMPLAGSILATLGVITFMGVWNDYFMPLIVLSSKTRMTLPIALSQINGEYATYYNVLMAGSLLSMLPIICIYIVAQRYFESGLQLGGIKG